MCQHHDHKAKVSSTKSLSVQCQEGLLGKLSGPGDLKDGRCLHGDTSLLPQPSLPGLTYRPWGRVCRGTAPCSDSSNRTELGNLSLCEETSSGQAQNWAF